MAKLRVTVADKETIAKDVVRFDLVGEGNVHLPPFSAGAHIDVAGPTGMTRPYSLCNSEKDRGKYSIAVLRNEKSRGGSASMHDEVHIGTTLTISPPKNYFPLEPSAYSVLLAGGIGITPLFSMAKSLAAAGQPFELHYCARSRSRFAFRPDLEALKSAVFFHSDEEPEPQRLHLSSILRNAPADTRVYVCGPPGFIDRVIDEAVSLGFDRSRISYERFEGNEGSSGQAFEVQIASTGQVFVVASDETVVSALAREGIGIMTSCEQGICGTCMTKVLDGICDHRDAFLTDAERKTNEVFMPCCSRALSKRLLLDL